MMRKKNLLAFDFGRTILEESSDSALFKLLPDGKIPTDLDGIYEKDGWTAYLQKLFKILHSHGITESDYINCLENLKFSPGMVSFLTHIDSDSTDCIIISDSNRYFIDFVLGFHKLRHVFQGIFTNPAYFDDNGLLNIIEYHEQDWCKISEVNLCKGDVLNNYVKQRYNDGVEYGRIGFVCDGLNDLCPGLCLRGNDYLFAREDHKLIQFIEKNKNGECTFSCNIIKWNDACQISEYTAHWNNVVKNIPFPRLIPVGNN